MSGALEKTGRHPDQAKIYPSIKGVVFIGTPHRGSSKAVLGAIVARLTKLMPW